MQHLSPQTHVSEMQLLISGVRVKGRLQPPWLVTLAAMAPLERAVLQASSRHPSLGAKLWSCPAAPRGTQQSRVKEMLRGSRAQLRTLCAVWVWQLFVTNLDPGGTAEDMPSSPSTTECISAPEEEASCPRCWQWPWSFFPCDKYGNRVCIRSELGINAIAQIGES